MISVKMCQVYNGYNDSGSLYKNHMIDSVCSAWWVSTPLLYRSCIASCGGPWWFPDVSNLSFDLGLYASPTKNGMIPVQQTKLGNLMRGAYWNRNGTYIAPAREGTILLSPKTNGMTTGSTERSPTSNPALGKLGDEDFCVGCLPCLSLA